MKGPPVATLSIPLPDLGAITWTAPLPVVVTQHNALAIVGLPAERFLAMLRAPSFPLKVAKHGKVRAVERVAFVQWLLSQDDVAQRAPVNDTVDPVDALARRAGLSRRAG